MIWGDSESIKPLLLLWFQVVFGWIASVIPAAPTGPREARPDDRLRESRDPFFWLRVPDRLTSFAVRDDNIG